MGKSFVTFAAAACVLFSPLAALAVAADGAPVDAALVAPTADGSLLGQTLDLPAERLPLVPVGEAGGAA